MNVLSEQKINVLNSGIQLTMMGIKVKVNYSGRGSMKDRSVKHSNEMVSFGDTAISLHIPAGGRWRGGT